MSLSKKSRRFAAGHFFEVAAILLQGFASGRKIAIGADWRAYMPPLSAIINQGARPLDNPHSMVF